MKVKDQLLQLQSLLEIEREEDLRQYLEQFERYSIAARRKNGVTWYPVHVTSEELGVGDYVTAEFERTQGQNELHQFSNGKVIEIFSNSGDDNSEHWKIQGTIKHVHGNKMRIAFNTDELPGWIERGKIGINLLFDEAGYREMKFALDKVAEAENSRLAQLRDVLYGISTPSFHRVEEVPGMSGLNRSQQNAVNLIAAAQDVAVIHGPPGTGKTTTLIRAIMHTLMHEKQVLVCSPSNVAVDLLTEKLVQQGINVVRLGNPARVSEEVLQNTLDARMANHESFKELKQFRKRAEEFFSMAKKYKRNFGHAEREQRHLLYQEARQLQKDASALEDYILWDSFEKAQVIACTPVVAAGKLMRDLRFKTCFIDEAAQALEPMTWIPIIRSERVVFAGDHLQLPPTVKSKRAEDGGLKYTLFERVVRSHPNVAVMLNVQYRMHEKIMEFSNRMFYNNELSAYVDVKDNLLSFDEADDLLNRPLEFIDTAGTGYEEHQHPETLSYENEEEARLLIRHLGNVLQQYDQRPDESLRIGIIAPYKQQTEKLQALLHEQNWFAGSRHHFSIRTVDGFQGQERDIMCISMTRSNDRNEIGFLSDTRRMNVALTRAKRKLIVIGDSATLGAHSFYKSFLDYADEIQGYRSAWEFMEV